jgi:hypothetical protein
LVRGESVMRNAVWRPSALLGPGVDAAAPIDG